jgi:thiosulfate/3-mercaptopyruvate sulfurtransferase
VNLPVFFLGGPGGGPPAPEALAPRLGSLGISRDTHVVAYDEGNSPSAARLFWVLRYLNHPRVSILDGGITNWRHEGRDWEYSLIRPQAVEYAPGPLDDSVVATLGEVRGLLDSDSGSIVDVRSPGEYLGVQTSAARNGHIPGAVNIDCTNNLQASDDGIALLRSDGDLSLLYQEAGVTPDKRVVVYCQSGARAAETFFVLQKLGYPSVALYTPGWQEWGNRSDTPVDA